MTDTTRKLATIVGHSMSPVKLQRAACMSSLIRFANGNVVLG
jgi:hypothetical protein